MRPRIRSTNERKAAKPPSAIVPEEARHRVGRSPKHLRVVPDNPGTRRQSEQQHDAEQLSDDREDEPKNNSCNKPSDDK